VELAIEADFALLLSSLNRCHEQTAFCAARLAKGQLKKVGSSQGADKGLIKKGEGLR